MGMKDSALSNPELKFLQRLECAIHNAYLEAMEFPLYSVLQTLLEAYAESFTIIEESNTSVFVHATPQDTLTGPEEVNLAAKGTSVQAIPDATVRITRLHRDQEKKAHHVVLVIEAKRLVKDGKSMWFIYCFLLGVVISYHQGYHGTLKVQNLKHRMHSHLTFPSLCSKHFQLGQNVPVKNAFMLGFS